jgi:hypothetical protein
LSSRSDIHLDEVKTKAKAKAKAQEAVREAWWRMQRRDGLSVVVGILEGKVAAPDSPSGAEIWLECE